MPKWMICCAMLPLLLLALLGWMHEGTRSELQTARKCCVGPLGNR